MTDTTTPPASNPPSSGSGDHKPGIDANHLAEEGKKVAVKAWDWTKKAIAFAWPKVKQGAHVVSEKVDKEMDKIIESVNHPEHKEASASSPAPTAPSPVTDASQSPVSTSTNNPVVSEDQDNSIPPR